MFDLNNISIILCNPSHPGNIGFAARAMKTMGFEHMVIISEREIDIAAAKVTAVAAADVIDNCTIVKVLADVLDNFHFIAALTARSRTFRSRIDLPELPAVLSQQPKDAKIGLLFGREQSGLTNEELEVCQCAVTIPTSKTFHSMNLSHAVQAVCYELIRDVKREDNASLSTLELRQTASVHEREAIFAKLEAAMVKVGLKGDEAEKINKIFRMFFGERPLGKKEAGALHRFFDEIIHCQFKS